MFKNVRSVKSSFLILHKLLDESKLLDQNPVSIDMTYIIMMFSQKYVLISMYKNNCVIQR